MNDSCFNITEKAPVEQFDESPKCWRRHFLTSLKPLNRIRDSIQRVQIEQFDETQVLEMSFLNITNK